MRPLWLCWALWALPLAGPGAALTEERVLGRLLRQLRLSEAPVLDEADVERLVIPAHVRAQYVALLQRSHGARSRGKRFSQNFRGEALPPCCSLVLVVGGEGLLWGGGPGAQGPQGDGEGPWTVRKAGPGPLVSVCTEGPTLWGQEELGQAGPAAKAKARTDIMG